MIDLREKDAEVAARAEAFDKAHTELNRARARLNGAMDRAFGRDCPFNSGDRIRMRIGTDVLGRGGYFLDGRAVIMRDGTRMGLYLDNNGQRQRIEPRDYANVQRIR